MYFLYRKKKKIKEEEDSSDELTVCILCTLPYGTFVNRPCWHEPIHGSCLLRCRDGETVNISCPLCRERLVLTPTFFPIMYVLKTNFEGLHLALPKACYDEYFEIQWRKRIRSYDKSLKNIFKKYKKCKERINRRKDTFWCRRNNSNSNFSCPDGCLCNDCFPVESLLLDL